MGKRVFSLIMAGILTAGLLVGCGSNSEDANNDYAVQSEQATDEQKQGEESETLENVDTEDIGIEETESNETEEKTIIVYFSATGNTEQVAGVIAEATGGELLAELAGSGEWKEGMRFPSNASDEEVREWVESLESSQKR